MLSPVGSEPSSNWPLKENGPVISERLFGSINDERFVVPERPKPEPLEGLFHRCFAISRRRHFCRFA